MLFKRYLLNLFKVENRKLATQLGGHPEVTTSARVGYMRYKYGYWWTTPACNFLNWLYDEVDHCGGALASEDDPLDKYVSDPEGKFFIPLLLFWITVRIAVLACISFTIGYTIGALW